MTNPSEPKFAWPAYPTNEREFETLMQAMDAVLEERGLQPFQRDIHVAHLLGEALGWSGSLFPDASLALQPGFRGDVLFAKARGWYQNLYGERMRSGASPGGVPIRLGNALWRLTFPLIFGTASFHVTRELKERTQGASASANMLDYVEGLTPALANSLDDAQLTDFAEFFIGSLETIHWRESLPDAPLFEMAANDYDASTSDLLGRRYGQARWGAQQAVEKTIKGLLKHAGTSYATGGPNGHSLSHLDQLLKTHHGVDLDADLLDGAKCSPGVRYNEEPSTETQALLANHAVLGVLKELRESARVSELLAPT